MRPTPNLPWRLFVTGGVAALAAGTASEAAWKRLEPVVPATSRRQLQALLGATVAVHVAEALTMRRTVRRDGLPTPRRWVASTLAWGFPVMYRARKVRRAQATLASTS